MIIKKPYAFLIKYFRIIHGFLFLALLFILIKSFNIYTFFNDYAINRYYSNISDLSSSYINYFNFILIIIALLITIIIYFILNIKKKDNKTYLFLSILMILLFIYNIYMLTVFNKLETTYIDIKTIRIYRDISLIMIILQVIFTIQILLRTLGFNIKQFEFKKDMENMNIVASDNEEIELSVEDNSYKYKRFFRKIFRLAKYEIKENKLFVICISSALVLILSLSIFLKINVYNKEYSENQSVSANSLVYKVNESYITKYDINNKVISSNKKYLIIKINIKNNYLVDYNLNRETFSLIIDNESITPIFSLKNEFSDLGKTYESTSLEPNTNKDYLIIFELDNDNNDSHYTLKIKNNIGNTISEIESKYKYIKVTPINLDETELINEYNLTSKIDLNDSILKDMTLSIDKYEINDKFKDSSTILSSNSYKNIYYTMVPNNISNGDNTILKLTSSLEINEDNNLYNIINNSSKLIDYYGIISYKSLGKEKQVNVDLIETKYNNNKYIYIDVPNDIKKADYIKLLLIIRGKKYIINLK